MNLLPFAISSHGYQIAVCRTASEELKQLGVRVEEGIDITSDASVVD